MKELKVGEKVRVYGWTKAVGSDDPLISQGAKAEVVAEPDSGGVVSLKFCDGAQERVTAHVRQLRKLKPAPPRQELYASVSPQGVVGRASSKPFPGAKRFVEAKEKA
jgi:hypothetical protein